MKSFRGFLGPLFLLALAAFGFYACNVSSSDDNQVFTFATLKDSLSKYDSAVIVLRDPEGTLIDTLFHGAIISSTTLRNLEAPHYKGGKVVIDIDGFQGGKIVYQIQKNFNGKTGSVDSTIPVILPSTQVRIDAASMKMRVGDTLVLPKALVSPANLSAPVLSWSSSNPQVLAVDTKGMHALSAGTAYLIARLTSDTSKSDRISVEVTNDNVVKPKVDSLRLSPDTLIVAVSGAPGRFQISVYPKDAPSEVTWGSLDSTVARVDSSGLVRGLKAALTRVYALSKSAMGIADTGWVKVRPSVQPDSARFQDRSLEVFQQGAAESLVVKVYPPLANPAVDFVLRNTTVAKITNGKVQGIAEGETWIVAHSIQNPALTDSLLLTILPATQVDSVVVKPDTARLYINGEKETLHATLYPTTLKARLQWRSGSSGVVSVDTSGTLSPVAPGYAYVTAVSRADSTKRDSTLVLVKRDVPKVFVGGDTAISVGKTLKIVPVVTQEYGSVTQFKWDLNGDGVFDDSSADVREVSYTYATAGDFQAKFYVKDTEGNDTTVIKNVKAVNGLVVQITSPKNGVYVNASPATIVWSVNDTVHSDKEVLQEGSNIVTRSATDLTGNMFSAAITLNLDTKVPNKPVVRGSTGPVNTRNPTWTWSGGGEGSGNFRARLDNPDPSPSKIVSDTFFTPDTALSEGAHILYVQEEDLAGNWSVTGQYAVRIDLTPPSPPHVSVTPSPYSKDPRPVWSWSSGTAPGMGLFRYKLDNSDFRTGEKDTLGTSLIPTMDLGDGKHTLYVEERDSAGNWSATDSAFVTVDRLPPNAPNVAPNVTSPTNNPLPTWNWTSGGGGGIGIFRYKLNDSNLDIGTTPGTKTSFTPVASLPEDLNVLYVQEEDSAGNWSPARSSSLRVDLTKPAAPTVTVTQTSPTNEKRPTWNWTKAEPGPGYFRYSLDNAAYKDTVSTNFRPGADLFDGAHTVKVQERDSAGNWSDVSNAAPVTIDATPPNPPVMSQNQPLSPVDNLQPKWQWTSGGGGGSGQFHYRVNNATYSAYGTATSYQSISNLPEGEYTLYVQERDAAGNESAEASRKIVVVKSGPVGGQGISNGAAGFVSMAFDNSGIPYVAINEGGQGRVLKYDGTSWSTLGGSFFSTGAGPISMAVFGTSVYVTYEETVGNTYEIKVKKSSGGTWQSVGSNYLDSGNFSYVLSAVISNSGVPYVGWIQDGSTVLVKGYNSLSDKWENAGVQDIGQSTDDGGDISLAFNASNELYVAFTDWGTTGSAHTTGAPTIKKLQGNTWIGLPGNSIDYQTPNVSLAFKNDTPWVAINSTSNTVLAFKYSGGNWGQVGDSAVSPNGDHAFIGFSLAGTPFISYNDKSSPYSSSATISVKSIVGSHWTYVGISNGSPSPSSEQIKLAISPIGVPFVAFNDDGQGGKLTVEKFGYLP